MVLVSTTAPNVMLFPSPLTTTFICTASASTDLKRKVKVATKWTQFSHARRRTSFLRPSRSKVQVSFCQSCLSVPLKSTRVFRTNWKFILQAQILTSVLAARQKYNMAKIYSPSVTPRKQRTIEVRHLREIFLGFFTCNAKQNLKIRTTNQKIKHFSIA